ncbi:hypothetical protein AB0F85_25155 [Nocardia fluminea]|uniref:hypothetical protein n=1 Tax=Nocardia fluminea TaxID=134984 RepID=UPI0033BFF5C6
MAFAADTFERSSSRAEGLSRFLHELLSIDIGLDEARNAWELGVWGDVLSERQEQKQARGTLKWWTASVKEVKEFMDSPAYQAPELPDLRTELRGDLDAVLDDPDSLTNQFSAGIT